MKINKGGAIFSSSSNSNDVLNTAMKVVGVLLVILIIYYLFFSGDSTSHGSMLDARKMVRIPASKLPKQSVSNTYAMWFYINDWNYNYGENKILLKRISEDGGPGPAILLDAFDNMLKIRMSYGMSKDKAGVHVCRVRNIPIQKWVHLAVTTNNLVMDIYLDGKLVRTCILPGVPQTTTSDGFIAGDEKRQSNGGFNGLISELRSWSRPLTPREVFNEYRLGSGSLFSMFNRFRLRFSVLDRNTEIKTIVL